MVPFVLYFIPIKPGYSISSIIILRSTEEAVRGGHYGPGLELPTERGLITDFHAQIEHFPAFLAISRRKEAVIMK